MQKKVGAEWHTDLAFMQIYLQFMLSVITIHAPKVQFIFHYHGGRVITDKTTPPRRGDPYVVARSYTKTEGFNFTLNFKI